MLKSILFILFISATSNGQQRIIDSLNHQLPTTNDTLLLVRSKFLSMAAAQINIDSAIAYDSLYLALSKKLKFSLQEADALMESAGNLNVRNPIKSMELLYASKEIIENPANSNMLPERYLKMLDIPDHIRSTKKYQQYLLAINNAKYAILYWLNQRNQKALEHLRIALTISSSLKAQQLMADCYLGLGVLAQNPDSSISHYKKSIELSTNNLLNYTKIAASNFIAQVYAAKKDFRSEFIYRMYSLNENITVGRIISAGWSYVGMADYYSRSVINRDSAMYYAYKGLQIGTTTQTHEMQYWAAMHLSDIYRIDGNTDSAYKYRDLMLTAREENSSDDKSRQFENFDYTLQARDAAIQASNEQLRNKVKTYSFIAGIIVIALLAIVFWRDSKRKQKQVALLQRQKAKTDEALRNLQSAQAQLIQSEKMASLGELTAGIAHEIQNPLNFVNNFSEVNNELLKELNSEAEKGNIEEVRAIVKDIQFNSEKINHHGKRADSIVKGMLQHSRTSSGQQEPTDINALADEYLRLAYHGLRAKDKSFNASMKTDFDQSIGKINVVPQEIGRVILNLINNAFYAVNEKQKHASTGYEPAVTVSTEKQNGKVEIKVEDNGNGIPKKNLDKIFQPFFTTKPTGEGTGLGLSLSYDVVKSHGGEIKVESQEGKGSVFIICLNPL